VQLRAELSGRRLPAFDASVARDELLATSLPAGTYRVVASDDEPAPMCATGWDPVPARWSEVEALVHVVAGETAEVELRFAGGGRVDLDLALTEEVRARHLAAWWRDHPTASSPAHAGWLRQGLRGPAARVFARPSAGGIERELEFFVPELFAVAHGHGVIPGMRATSYTTLPEGRYALRIDARGFEPWTGEVEVSAERKALVRAQLVDSLR
jgi:hypothetical protein